MRQSRDINNNYGSRYGSSSGCGDTGAVIKAEIVEWMSQEEGQYQVSAIAAEVDPWLQYTRQEEVLARSKYSLVETTMFTTTTTATKPELEQVL